MLYVRLIAVLLLIATMGGDRSIRKRGRNPKKKRHDRKHPKRTKLDDCPVDMEVASIATFPVGIVEDASIGSDVDDNDSCFP